MEAKLDSRQGQFPATFPDTFKDFFAMMSEDEDHMDLFSNLLEDKVIPHTNNTTTNNVNKFAPRRHGGSLRCTTHPHNSTSSDSAGSRGCGSVGRSSSFRVHRPRTTFGSVSGCSSSSITTLNNMGMGGGSGGSVASSGGSSSSMGGNGNLFCKHIKYCCLHQQHQHQQQQQSPQQLTHTRPPTQVQQPVMGATQQKSPHRSNSQRFVQQQQQQQQQPPQHVSQGQQSQLNAGHFYKTTNYSADYASDALSVSVRLGPDGEDNCGDGSKDRQKQYYASQAQQQQQQKQQRMGAQKRHSVILERAFDFDASCEESDTISTTSSTPTAPEAPSTVLKPILKKPSTAPPLAPYIPAHPAHQAPPAHLQQQPQHLPHNSNMSMKASGKDAVPHRTLPTPPKGVGMGAYHTREAVLQRVQKQSGLLSGSRTNLSALGSALNIAGTADVGCGDCVSGEIHYSGSNYNFDAAATTAGTGSGGGGNTSASVSATMGVDDGAIQEMGAAATGGGGGPGTGMYIELHSPVAPTTNASKFNDLLNASGNTNFVNTSAATLNAANRNNPNSKRMQKSPLLARRRSSSIVTNLLASDISYNRSDVMADIVSLRGAAGTLPHSSTRDRIALAKSPVSNKPSRLPSLVPVEGGVLTFQQAISGAVSPQYSATTPLLYGGCGVGGSLATNLDMLHGSSSALASVREDATTGVGGVGPTDTLTAGDSPTSSHAQKPHNSGAATTAERTAFGGDGRAAMDSGCVGIVDMESSSIRFGSNILHSSSATIAQLGSRQRQRMRTSSMPAESRKPRLVDTRRSAIHCADIDLEYYRLRSFSITSHGVCNLGDSLRSRRSRSINSVTSTGTSNSGKDRHNSNASHVSGDNIFDSTDKPDLGKSQIPAYKIAMLGASGVGKTTLTYQFTTSDYICAYDLSLDDDYGQKTVSVLVDGIETDLEIIDHPACEMSTEAFCSTYNIDLFVVVYSVVDRNSFKAAEKILQYLKEHEMLLTRGAILVGNKTDLERHREVNRQTGRKLAKEICCKFIETSSGLDHNVNELLVGIVAQAKLNPQRIRNLSERDRQRLSLQNAIQKHRHMHMPPRRIVRQMSLCHNDEDQPLDSNEGEGGTAAEQERDENQSNNIMYAYNGDEGLGTGSEHTVSTSLSSSGAGKSTGSLKSAHGQKSNKRTLNLESILKMGESELEDEEDLHRQHGSGARGSYKSQSQVRPMGKFDLLMSSGKNSVNTSPKSRRCYGSSPAMVGRGGGGPPGRRSISDGGDNEHFGGSQTEEQLLDESGRKTVSKLTNRTKVFLSSVLKFKKAVNMRRRNSSSCSDLFVI